MSNRAEEQADPQLLRHSTHRHHPTSKHNERGKAQQYKDNRSSVRGRTSKKKRNTNLIDAGVVDPEQHAYVRRKVCSDAVPGFGDEAVFLPPPRGGIRVGEGRCGVRTHPGVGDEYDKRSAAVGQIPVPYQRPVVRMEVVSGVVVWGGREGMWGRDGGRSGADAQWASVFC